MIIFDAAAEGEKGDNGDGEKKTKRKRKSDGGGGGSIWSRLIWFACTTMAVSTTGEHTGTVAPRKKTEERIKVKTKNKKNEKTKCVCVSVWISLRAREKIVCWLQHFRDDFAIGDDDGARRKENGRIKNAHSHWQQKKKTKKKK